MDDESEETEEVDVMRGLYLLRIAVALLHCGQHERGVGREVRGERTEQRQRCTA